MFEKNKQDISGGGRSTRLAGAVSNGVKRFWDIIEAPPVYLTILIILVAFISFGLGRLSLFEEKKPEVKINMPVQVGEVKGESATAINTILPTANVVVASKNGTKYYFSWCSGISRISPQNKVTFSGAKEAEQAG